ncbi:MAG TPA: phospholipase D-like domain-containing protein [Burkholderiaceae bacterium]|jgi:cardiolipin synthase
MFPGLTLAYWLTLHGVVTLLAVLIYVATAHMLRQRRAPTAAIAWVLFILLVPYVALPLFLTFGSRKQARPRGQPLRLAPPAPGDPEDERAWAVQTALALGQGAPARFDDLHLHAGGAEALRALRQVIDGAAESIDLCTFILGPDAIGREVVERLAAKARSGVRVRLMLDGLGRLMAGKPSLRPLVEAGGVVTRFAPPLRWPLRGRSNLRDHRKLVIADAGRATQRLWSGGRNLASEYFEGDAERPAWHDLSFDLRGDIVQDTQALFEHDWVLAHRGHLAPTPRAAREELPLGEGAQLIASGPDQFDDTIYALLVTAAYRARSRIALVTPYFVPDSALLMALCMAARRGVVVDLLLPARSNHRLSDLARRRALCTLADAGGRIWFAPQMLHAKLVVIDERLALAGSANLDSRSLFLNYELMLAFHEPDVVRRFAAWFETERATAQRTLPRRPGLFGDLADGLVLSLGFQL